MSSAPPKPNQLEPRPAHPSPAGLKSGGRVELRRVSESVEVALGSSEIVYEARWATPQGTFQGELRVSAAGPIAPSFEGESPPTWLVDWTVQLLSVTARTVTRDPSGRWPRRLTRWRASPEER